MELRATGFAIHIKYVVTKKIVSLFPEVLRLEGQLKHGTPWLVCDLRVTCTFKWYSASGTLDDWNTNIRSNVREELGFLVKSNPSMCTWEFRKTKRLITQACVRGVCVYGDLGIVEKGWPEHEYTGHIVVRVSGLVKWKPKHEYLGHVHMRILAAWTSKLRWTPVHVYARISGASPSENPSMCM